TRGRDVPNGSGKMSSVAAQLGVILVLPIYFRPRTSRFLATFPRGQRGDPTVFTPPLTLVLVAFVITAGPAWLLHKKIGDNLESMAVIGWSLLVGGIIMWIVDARFGATPANGRFKTEHVEQMSAGQAIWIGFCQIASAVFPGTSRSMSTIASGQLAG